MLLFHGYPIFFTVLYVMFALFTVGWSWCSHLLLLKTNSKRMGFIFVTTREHVSRVFCSTDIQFSGKPREIGRNSYKKIQIVWQQIFFKIYYVAWSMENLIYHCLINFSIHCSIIHVSVSNWELNSQSWFLFGECASRWN